MRCDGTIRRQKVLNSILLLSVLFFSVSTSAHWLWHDAEHDSCRDTAHSCRNETLGNRRAAWQLPVHPPVNFSGHDLQCPVCSGLLGLAEVPPEADFCNAEIGTLCRTFAAETAPSRFSLSRAARGPPCRA